MLDTVDLLTPQRLSLYGKKWKYRGEGNANLVLALPQERKIVRLRKYESTGVRGTEDEERERVVRETLFCRGMMVPLLGACYIQPPTAAYLELGDVRWLDQMLRPQRPVSRHHKGLQFCHATVYPDYALLPQYLHIATTPTFCVEIKPKQGWIPLPDRRLPKCTFCLSQYLKLQRNSIHSISQYCPLDLFSGNVIRMKRALHSLMASPQNNFKIFEDGVLVYSDDVGEDGELYDILQRWLGSPNEITSSHTKLVDKFCDLVHTALTRPLCKTVPIQECSAVADACTPALVERVPGDLTAAVNKVLPEPPCDWTAEHLPQGCILDRILRIQKLEQFGADMIYQLYCSSQRYCQDYSYVPAMLQAGQNELSPVHRYLLATTAKDCSIMIAFQRLDIPPPVDVPDSHVIHDLDGQCHVFNIGVSDLDPKPISCIEKHCKRDCDILSACLEVFETRNSQMQI
ncbi:inositol-pentakisphosphate 2-kinase [Anabrus simplex]|uniref:inositol-pentakisphosphate 2-kinase n=1 Tax=Anabrus simplex TaxID=316456 RepID=UPI0035A3ACA8